MKLTPWPFLPLWHFILLIIYMSHFLELECYFGRDEGALKALHPSFDPRRPQRTKAKSPSPRQRDLRSVPFLLWIWSFHIWYNLRLDRDLPDIFEAFILKSYVSLIGRPSHGANFPFELPNQSLLGRRPLISPLYLWPQMTLSSMRSLAIVMVSLRSSTRNRCKAFATRGASLCPQSTSKVRTLRPSFPFLSPIRASNNPSPCHLLKTNTLRLKTYLLKNRTSLISLSHRSESRVGT